MGASERAEILVRIQNLYGKRVDIDQASVDCTPILGNQPDETILRVGLSVWINQGVLQFHGAAIGADQREIWCQAGARRIYSMTAQTSAFVVEQHLAARRIAGQGRGSRRVIGE